MRKIIISMYNITFYLYKTECVICLDSFGPKTNTDGGIDSNFETKPSKEKSCFFILLKRIIRSLENYKNSIYAKTDYMLTPCNHLFHSNCLESWLANKSECPYCRQEIPPLE